MIVWYIKLGNSLNACHMLSLFKPFVSISCFCSTDSFLLLFSWAALCSAILSISPYWLLTPCMDRVLIAAASRPSVDYFLLLGALSRRKSSLIPESCVQIGFPMYLQLLDEHFFSEISIACGQTMTGTWDCPIYVTTTFRHVSNGTVTRHTLS